MVFDRTEDATGAMLDFTRREKQIIEEKKRGGGTVKVKEKPWRDL